MQIIDKEVAPIEAILDNLCELCDRSYIRKPIKSFTYGWSGVIRHMKICFNCYDRIRQEIVSCTDAIREEAANE